MTRCLLCGDPAVAVFMLSDGCVCMPSWSLQPLCSQHSLRASPIGEMDLVEDLTEGHEFTALWERTADGHSRH